MKNKLTRFVFSVLIIITVVITAFAQREKDKNNPKEQQQNQGKKDQKDNRGNTDVKDNKGNNANNGVNGDQGNNDGKNNNSRNDDNMNKGKNLDYGYKWDRENFKDRRKFRSQDKVTVCHKFNGDNNPAVSIRVSSNALKAHMDHGDFMGDCPVVTNRRFSDIFLSRRTEYYNYLQESQEQVLYSRSMLDYALARLTESRSQLVIYQNSNMPPADIQYRQTVVVELEQNVSLLEALIGVAANLLVNKLQ